MQPTATGVSPDRHATEPNTALDSLRRLRRARTADTGSPGDAFAEVFAAVASAQVRRPAEPPPAAAPPPPVQASDSPPGETTVYAGDAPQPPSGPGRQPAETAASKLDTDGGGDRSPSDAPRRPRVEVATAPTTDRLVAAGETPIAERTPEQTVRPAEASRSQTEVATRQRPSDQIHRGTDRPSTPQTSGQPVDTQPPLPEPARGKTPEQTAPVDSPHRIVEVARPDVDSQPAAERRPRVAAEPRRPVAAATDTMGTTDTVGVGPHRVAGRNAPPPEATATVAANRSNAPVQVAATPTPIVAAVTATVAASAASAASAGSSATGRSAAALGRPIAAGGPPSTTGKNASPSAAGVARSAKPVDTAETIARVKLVQRVAKAFAHLRQQSGQVRMRLATEGLGSVAVEMQVRGGRVDAAVIAESEAASTTLREHLPELRSKLQQSGLQVDRLEVRTEDQPGGHKQPPHRQPPRRQPKPHRNAEPFELIG